MCFLSAETKQLLLKTYKERASKATHKQLKQMIITKMFTSKSMT